MIDTICGISTLDLIGICNILSIDKIKQTKWTPLADWRLEAMDTTEPIIKDGLNHPQLFPYRCSGPSIIDIFLNEVEAASVVFSVKCHTRSEEVRLTVSEDANNGDHEWSRNQNESFAVAMFSLASLLQSVHWCRRQQTWQ